MRKKFMVLSIGFITLSLAVVCMLVVIGSKETANAEVGFVNYDRVELEFVKTTADGLDCYSDDRGGEYYYRDGKLNMIKLPDKQSSFSVDVKADKNDIIEKSQNFLKEKMKASVPSGMIEKVVYEENIGNEYLLSQKIGDKEVILVSLSYSMDGNLISGVFMDDKYLTSDKQKEILAYDDQTAIEAARAYIEADEELSKILDYAFDKDVKISIDLTCGEKWYKIVSFETTKEDLTYKVDVYIDVFNKKVDFIDQYK